MKEALQLYSLEKAVLCVYPPGVSKYRSRRLHDELRVRFCISVV